MGPTQISSAVDTYGAKAARCTEFATNHGCAMRKVNGCSTFQKPHLRDCNWSDWKRQCKMSMGKGIKCTTSCEKCHGTGYQSVNFCSAYCRDVYQRWWEGRCYWVKVQPNVNERCQVYQVTGADRKWVDATVVSKRLDDKESHIKFVDNLQDKAKCEVLFDNGRWMKATVTTRFTKNSSLKHLAGNIIVELEKQREVEVDGVMHEWAHHYTIQANQIYKNIRRLLWEVKLASGRVEHVANNDIRKPGWEYWKRCTVISGFMDNGSSISVKCGYDYEGKEHHKRPALVVNIRDEFHVEIFRSQDGRRQKNKERFPIHETKAETILANAKNNTWKSMLAGLKWKDVFRCPKSKECGKEERSIETYEEDDISKPGKEERSIETYDEAEISKIEHQREVTETHQTLQTTVTVYLHDVDGWSLRTWLESLSTLMLESAVPGEGRLETWPLCDRTGTVHDLAYVPVLAEPSSEGPRLLGAGSDSSGSAASASYAPKHRDDCDGTACTCFDLRRRLIRRASDSPVMLNLLEQILDQQK